MKGKDNKNKMKSRTNKIVTCVEKKVNTNKEILSCSTIEYIIILYCTTKLIRGTLPRTNP